MEKIYKGNDSSQSVRESIRFPEIARISGLDAPGFAGLLICLDC